MNIRPLQNFIGRLCGVLLFAGFLIRPATGCSPATLMHALEHCSNDLTFEGQAPFLDMSCGVAQAEWFPVSGGMAKPKGDLCALREHTLPLSKAASAHGGNGFLPVDSGHLAHPSSLRDVALHPTQEISHEGCPKRYTAPAHQLTVLERVFKAVRSPLARLSEKQTVLDPSTPPPVPERVTQMGGQAPQVRPLSNHQCQHVRPPTLRAA